MANDSHGASVDSVIGLIERDCSTGQFRGKVMASHTSSTSDKALSKFNQSSRALSPR